MIRYGHYLMYKYLIEFTEPDGAANQCKLSETN